MIDNTFYESELEGKIHALEHFRFATRGARIMSAGKKRVAFSHCDHLSVAVLKDGQLHLGWARCSLKDQYRRKLGYQLSKRRALESVWYEGREHKPTNNGSKLPLPLPTKGRELAKQILDVVFS